MELRLLTAPELKQLHKTALRRAFPPNELKPYSVMAAHMRAGCYDPLALEDGDREVSWGLFWHSQKCVLLDYLLTVPERRGEGLGAELVRRAAERYLPGRPVLVESEAPTAERPEERALQERRLGFYRRLGFRYAGFDVLLYGVHYQVLVLGEGENLRDAYLELYRSGVSDHFMKHFLKIL